MNEQDLIQPLLMAGIGLSLAIIMMLGLGHSRLSRWPILLFGFTGCLLSVLQVAQENLASFPPAPKVQWKEGTKVLERIVSGNGARSTDSGRSG
jgi:hypothetical protein